MTLIAGIVAVVVGLVAVGCAGVTPRRRGTRWTIILLACGSTLGGMLLLIQVGGLPLLVPVLAGICGLILACSVLGVIAWFLLGLIASVDEALTKRESPRPTDFAFLNQKAGDQQPSPNRRKPLTDRMGLTTARERIAKMTWFFRKPPS